VLVKEQFSYISLRMENGPERRQGPIRDSQLLTTVNVGVVRDLSMSFRIPVVFRSREFDRPSRTDRDEGLDDVAVLAKYRFFKLDSGPLDTIRASVIAGVDIRSGDSPFTSDATNPILGLALTQIAGRHGFNASLQWTFTTAGTDQPIYAGETTADVLRYDVAYLYRLYPEQYDAATPGALYAVAELNGIYETSGDNEVFVAPGIMWEAKHWTFEFGVQVPVWRDLSQRARSDYMIMTGLRFSW
jgi:hypothetical protein